MASQRQGKSGGTTAAVGTSAPNRTHANKAAAGRAQAKAARERAAAQQTEQAGSQPARGRLGAWLSQREPDTMPAPPGWLQWTTFGLAIIALGLSIYLTIVELEPAALVCSDTGIVNCANVLHSAEGHIFGIPVAYFGLAFFVCFLPLNSPWAWRRPETWVRHLRLASVIVAICFVIYLVYAELIEIGNICIYCTSVHIVTFVLFVLIVFDAAFRRPPVGAVTQRR
jgi:uncharacterized membrane protein